MFLTFRRVDKWRGLSYSAVSKCCKISDILGKLYRQATGQIVELKKKKKLSHYNPKHFLLKMLHFPNTYRMVLWTFLEPHFRSPK